MITGGNMEIKTKIFTLASFLLALNDAMGADANPAVTLDVQQSFIDDVKKPSSDQKNGMLVFPVQSTDEVRKFASGVFPTMSKYFDPTFLELVDILLPGKSPELKILYRLYAKLSDIINKTTSCSKPLQQSEKEALEKSIETLKMDIIGCLSGIPKGIDLGEEKDKWLDKCDSGQRLGNTLNKGLQAKVGAVLSNLISEYKEALCSYYEMIIVELAPEEHKNLVSLALESLRKTGSTPSEFKKFMNNPSAEWLRKYAYTEDMMVYQLIKGILQMEPKIFSLNDMCPDCRKKFKHSTIRSQLPPNIVYCSILQLHRPVSTTVDYIFDGHDFLQAQGQDHTPLFGICQVRIPEQFGVTQQWVVEFASPTSFLIRNAAFPSNMVDLTEAKGQTQPSSEMKIQSESDENMVKEEESEDQVSPVFGRKN